MSESSRHDEVLPAGIQHVVPDGRMVCGWLAGQRPTAGKATLFFPQ
jgi:hypothetical protein